MFPSRLDVVTTSHRSTPRLFFERSDALSTAARLREFVGLQDAPPRSANSRISPLAAIGVRAGQAAFAVAALAAGIWLLPPFGGLVAGAAAKAGGLFARGAERLQNGFLLPACDAPESREAILELVRDRLGSAAVLEDFVQRGQRGDERICNALARRGVQTA